MKRITLLLPLCIGCLSGFAQLRPYTLAHESQASINSDNSATRRPQVASTPLFSAAKTLAGAENGYGVAFDLGYVRFPLATPRKVGYYLTHANQAKQDLSAARWKIGFLKRLAPLPLPYDRLYAKMKK